MKHPQDVIQQPLITEKSTILRERKDVYCFKVHPRASKIEIAKAIESPVPEGQGRRRAHFAGSRQGQAHGSIRGEASRLEKGLGPADAGFQGNRVLRRKLIRRYTMAIKKYKPTTAGRRFMTSVVRIEGSSTNQPHKPLLSRHKKSGGRDSRGHIAVRHRGGGHKRRYRIIDFPTQQDRHPGQGRTRRVRSQPLGQHRPRVLHGR